MFLSDEARNLKFFPISLQNAMFFDSRLNSVRKSFKVVNCQGCEKLFKYLSTWELLNLRASTILDIPNRLRNLYGISDSTLSDIMSRYSVQSLGKEYLERQRSISTPGYVYSTARHYSWPKGLDLTGIGFRNAIEVKLDAMARMSLDSLKCQLNKCIAKKRAIYAVMVILGTTEQGVVEPLDEVLALRDEMEKKHGFTFLIHVDAAWGGYFASMLRHPEPTGIGNENEYRASILLHPQVIKQLNSMSGADTITIDPHKSGYVPLPAGVICYKDRRMKELIRWTAPYTIQSEVAPVGAACASVWLSHKIIGLHDRGIGAILSEATWNFRRDQFCCHLYLMTGKDNGFSITFLKPTLAGPRMTDLYNERDFIKRHILDRDNTEILNDKMAMNLLTAMGSDLNVNCFICNFNVNGVPNKDIRKANDLNKRISGRCTINSSAFPRDVIPFHTSSTVLTEAQHGGECLQSLKRRSGLEGGGEIFVLRVVVMSPFYLSNSVMSGFVSAFEDIIEQEVQKSCFLL
ncbi:hypothetical protein Clacol_004800 [Clathrus columnatus]|uniref:Uncharacterized protein n=1 Tax=Clathrus columnatus TaxID=1419009 RepID=A0AAV5AD53_9AGAM|nr:hypothetical protein Clacol_004800 [Clathrus columnatus]